LILGVLSVSCAEERRPEDLVVVGVRDLLAWNVAEAEARLVTERLRTELSRTGVFSAVHQGRGQPAHGVKIMVGGRVSYLDGRFSISLDLTDVATSRLARRFRGESVGGFQAFLSDVPRRAAEEFASPPPPTEPMVVPASPQLVHTLTDHTDAVRSVAVSLDGKYIVSGGDDHTVRVWNLADGALVRTLIGHTRSVHAVTLSPDGRYIVSGSYDKTIKVWRLSDGSHVRTIAGTTPAMSVAVSPDGQHIVSGNYDRTVGLWRLSDGAPVRTYCGHQNLVMSAAATPDGRHIVSGSLDRSVRVWDLVDGSLIRVSVGGRAATMSPDGRYIVSADSYYPTISVRRLADGSLVRTLPMDDDAGHGGNIASIAVSADGRHIISGGDDWTIKVWHLADGSLVRTLRGHAATVHSVATSPDGRFVVSASHDYTIKVWAVDDSTIAGEAANPDHASFTGK